MRRFLPLALLLALALTLPLATCPAQAQSSRRSALDSLVARISHGWGTAPCDDGCVQWTVMHGDSAALRAEGAEISGSERTGMYTVTIRPARYAAPLLVGRLRLAHRRDGVVTVRPVTRGATLTADDVALQSVRTWGAPVTASAATSYIGTEARRAIAPGETLRPSDVTAAPIVFAGDTVTAELIRDGVRLAMTGTALQTAALGGRVSIRLDRGRRFAGIATGRNTVRLD